MLPFVFVTEFENTCGECGKSGLTEIVFSIPGHLCVECAVRRGLIEGCVSQKEKTNETNPEEIRKREEGY